jgi:hypothetical protein
VSHSQGLIMASGRIERYDPPGVMIFARAPEPVEGQNVRTPVCSRPLCR